MREVGQQDRRVTFRIDPKASLVVKGINVKWTTWKMSQSTNFVLKHLQCLLNKFQYKYTTCWQKYFMSINNNLNKNMTSNILAIFAWAVDEFFDVIKAERSFVDVLASCQCLAKVLVFQFPVLSVCKVIKLWQFFDVIVRIPHFRVSSSNSSKFKFLLQTFY